MCFFLLQAFAIDTSINTIFTVDSRYQYTIGQRVKLSFRDTEMANVGYCEGKYR